MEHGSLEGAGRFPAVAGSSYLVRIGSKSLGQTGTGDFVVLADSCPGSGDNAFEDNDSCDQATTLVDGSFPGLFVDLEDPDWYAVEVPAGGTLTVDLLFDDTMGDIDAYLYDGCGGQLLDSSTTTNDDEHLSWTNSNTCDVTVAFVVGIHRHPGQPLCNTYDLFLSGAGSTGNSCDGLGTRYCDPSVPNFSGQGAQIAATGSAVVADNDVTLYATQLPPSQWGMFVNSMTTGSVTPPGSQGVLCLSGAIGRHSADIKNSGATGEFSLALDLTQVPTPGGPVAVQPGETWYWQAWFRDANPNATSNFTDGVCITFE